MEIVISVSEAELEEFPEEEAHESSGQQEQSGKTSPITSDQGRLQFVSL